MGNRLDTGEEAASGDDRAVEPWRRSTGPRTAEGKTAASRKGWKGSPPVVACRGAIRGRKDRDRPKAAAQESKNSCLRSVSFT